jgi:uncharacterized protein (TIGR02001 family)
MAFFVLNFACFTICPGRTYGTGRTHSFLEPWRGLLNNHLLLAASTLLTSLATGALAADWSVGGKLALTSDYMSRGFSENDGNPALQAGISATHNNGFYLSLCGSQVSDTKYHGASMELDAGFGWSGPLRDKLQLSLEAMHYHHPGSSVDTDHYNEYKIGLDYAFDGPTLGGAFYYSNDLTGSGESQYWDFHAGIPLGPVDLGLHYGLNRFSEAGADDYDDYAIGLSKKILGIKVDLSYMGASQVDAPCGWRDCKERAVLTLSKEF